MMSLTIQRELWTGVTSQNPFLGIEPIGGQLLFGTRLDFFFLKWHSWEKFEWLILSSQDLHWIKCFHYFHNFYIYMSFSILYSWVTQEKQIERAIHNISNSIFYQSRNPYLWLEREHLAEWWVLSAWDGMLSGSIKRWQWPGRVTDREQSLRTYWVFCMDYNWWFRKSITILFRKCRKTVPAKARCKIKSQIGTHSQTTM